MAEEYRKLRASQKQLRGVLRRETAAKEAAVQELGEVVASGEARRTEVTQLRAENR